MNILAIAFLVLFFILALCVVSTIIGIRGSTRAHRVAFYAGLIGLAAVLACFIAGSNVASQIPYITSGALLFTCGAVLFCTCCMCALALTSILQDRQRAA